MKSPSTSDRQVKVRAYLTDEVFGHDHWRAAQFCAPDVPNTRHAILTIFDSEAERDAAALVAPASAPAEKFAGLPYREQGFAGVTEHDQPSNLPPVSPPSVGWQRMADAAEMLWVVLANVNSGDWTKQSADWQEAAARWRDNYFAAIKGTTRDAVCMHGTALDVHCCNCHSGFIFDKDHECPLPPSPAPDTETK